MKVQDYLLDELKRLNRQNDLLEKESNKANCINLVIQDSINKNTLAMCQIANAIHMYL